MELYKLLQYGYLNMQMEDAQNTWFVKKTKEELSALQKQDEKVRRDTRMVEFVVQVLTMENNRK
jgi:hypothetical protein